MIIIHQYTQPRTGKKLVKVHYFRNGLYKSSSEVFAKDEKILKALLKGHKRYALVNVVNKYDLDFMQYSTKGEQ